MSNISKTDRMMAAARTMEVRAFSLSDEILHYATNLIQLFFGLLNGFIGLRFMLKLMLPSQVNPLVDALYSVTSPFIWAFKNLISSTPFGGGEIEFCCLPAIFASMLLGWLTIQLLWLAFVKPK